MKEIVLEPGAGRHIPLGTSEVITKATGAETHDHLSLFEFIQEPGGFGPSPHIHREREELFYVLEGDVDILVGEQVVKCQPGGFVLVPRGTPHTFANRGAQRAKLLVMFCPAGDREKYFEGLAELMKDGRKPDPQALAELFRKYDQEPVEVNNW
jgi:uncharacterized cupin superfamily protein